MDLDRRQIVAAGLGLAAATAAAPAFGETPMYGLIGRMKAVPGQRDALAAILLEGTGEMPGCLSYVVARDPADADALFAALKPAVPSAQRVGTVQPYTGGARIYLK